FHFSGIGRLFRGMGIGKTQEEQFQQLEVILIASDNGIKVIVKDNGNNGDAQTEGSRNKGRRYPISNFGNCPAFCSQITKGEEDPNNGPEQAEKGSNPTHGTQNRKS